MRWLFLLCVGCTGKVIGGLDEQQSEEVRESLTRVGIAAKVTRDPEVPGRNEIRVPRAMLEGARDVLHRLGLPRASTRGLREVFGKRGIVPTPMEERAALMDAIAGELVRSLRAIGGVLDARVHVVLGDRSDPANPEHPRASVLLVVDSKYSPEQADVKRLVVGAVPELALESIEVVTTRKDARAAIASPRRSQSALLPILAGVVVLLGLGLATSAWHTVLLRRRLVALTSEEAVGKGPAEGLR